MWRIIFSIILTHPFLASCQWVGGGISPVNNTGNSTDNTTAADTTTTTTTTIQPFSSRTESNSDCENNCALLSIFDYPSPNYSYLSRASGYSASVFSLDSNVYRSPIDVLSVNPPHIEVGYYQDNNAPFRGVMSLFFSDDKLEGVYCGGALITTTTIVTVARCAYNNSRIMYRYVHVAEGAANRDSAKVDLWYETEQVVLVHPEFNINDPHFKYNLAKLLLPVEIVATRPITIHQEYDFPNRHLVSVGYGRNSDLKPNKMLRYMDVRMVNNITCLAVYGPKICQNDVIPTIGAYDDNSLCRLESGAPLVQRRTILGHRLVGLASHISFSKCELGNLDMHVYLPKYYRWLTGLNQFAIYI